MNNIDQITVNRKQLAEILGYENEGSITNLVSVNGAPRCEFNVYPLVAFLKWYILDYLKPLHFRELQKLKKLSAQDEVHKANAELKRFELKRRQKEFIPAADVEREWLETMSMIITKLEGFPAKASPGLIGISDVKELREKLDIEVNKMRDDISKDGLKQADNYLQKKSELSSSQDEDTEDR